MQISKVLIAEENEDSAELFKEIVEDLGYNVFGVDTFDKAISLLNQGVAIDLIILSIVVNNKVYFENISKLRKLFPNIPIVSIASSKETNEKAKSLLMGCVDCICRPFEEDSVEVLFKGLKERVV